MIRDPTSQGSKTGALPNTLALSIDTHYASSLDYPTDSEHTIYHASDGKPSPTLTSYNSILHSSPEYLMNKAASYAITHFQTSKTPLINARIYHKAPQAPHPPIALIATEKTRLYLLLPVSQEKDHSETSWRSCTNNDCELHSEEKAEASYWPKDARKRNQSKTAKGKQAAIQEPIAPQKELSYSPPDPPYISEKAPPLKIEESLLDTPPMASLAFGPL